MRRIPTMMASAGAAALTTLAVTVAVPAIGDDGGGGGGSGATYPTTPSSLAACLSAHGVSGAPTDDTLKAWIGQRLDAGDATVRAAMRACAPGKVTSAGDERQLRSCLADHGADVPQVEGGDLKRWIIEHQHDPATAAALKACHLVIGDGPGPGDCAKPAPAGKPGDTPGADDKATTAKRAKTAAT
ncbi:MAG TPA: hypothetical protein VI318_04705 [Baekduia sp.]